jgi:hypothetical protein
MNYYNEIKKYVTPAREYDTYFTVACLFPEHEDHNPSMLIYEDGFFNCMGCSKVGHISELLKLESNAYFAAERLAMRAHNGSRYIDVPRFTDPEKFAYESYYWAQDQGIDWYWKSIRKMTDRMINQYLLGHRDGWNVIPIRTMNWEISGVIFRASPWRVEQGDPRYMIPAKQKPMLFVPRPDLVREADELFIVFGLIDAIVVASMGYPVVTTSGNGQKSFDPEWVKSFRKPIYILPDAGAQEWSSAVDLSRKIGNWAEPRELYYWGRLKDPADYYENDEVDLLHSELQGIING